MGGAGAGGGGVNGGNGERQGPSIAEEEDESSAADSEDDMRTDRCGVGNAPPPRGRAGRNVLEVADLDGGLEIDLNESGEDDSGYVHDLGADPPVDNTGAAVAAVSDDSGRRRKRVGKGKGNRHRRLCLLYTSPSPRD